MKTYLLVCSSMIPLLIIGCSDNRVDPPGNPLQLSVEDVGCAEAFLKFSLAASEIQRTLTFKRGDSTIATLTMIGQDSLFVDQGLLPKKTYTYTLAAGNWSAAAQATTMDTTSHNVTWETTMLGDGSSPVLYDVVILNDTLAYAVGEIYIRDSLGNIDPHAYNMVKWNGTSWQLMRIQFYTICGQSSRTSYPARAVFAFSETDMWIAMGGSQVARWNGTAQIATQCLPVSFSIRKLWGEHSNSLYAVGTLGTIMHYADGAWQQIASGTTVNINDIWGANTTSNGEPLILAAASNRYSAGELKLLQLNGTAPADTLEWSLQRRPLTVWFDSPNKIYVGGSGLFVGQPGRWKELTNLPNYAPARIRGTRKNNVWVVGSFGLCGHFNGLTWKSYPEVGLNGEYESVAVTETSIIAVGYADNRAVIVRGVLK